MHETHIFTTMLATRNSNDCVIFISNNGTQSEMQSIAKVIADYHIPIATISSTSDNPVAKQSNIVLTYGQTDENEMRMEPQLHYLHKCLLLIYCTIDILR